MSSLQRPLQRFIYSQKMKSSPAQHFPHSRNHYILIYVTIWHKTALKFIFHAKQLLSLWLYHICCLLCLNCFIIFYLLNVELLSADSIDVTSLEQLLHNICLLLTSRTREIVKASLGFLKVLLYALDVKVLASHLTVIVSDLKHS